MRPFFPTNYVADGCFVHLVNLGDSAIGMTLGMQFTDIQNVMCFEFGGAIVFPS